jgi:hypothetical protein
MLRITLLIATIMAVACGGPDTVTEDLEDTGGDQPTVVEQEAKSEQAQQQCEENEKKTLVCHKGKKTLCIGKPGLKGHMKHGDREGACEQDLPE